MDSINELTDVYREEYNEYLVDKTNGLAEYWYTFVLPPSKFKQGKLRPNNRTICLRDENKQICGWGDISNPININGEYTLSWYVRRAERGKGLGTKIIDELIRYSRENLGANQIEMAIKENNGASIRALEKVLLASSLKYEVERRNQLLLIRILKD